MRIPDIPLDIQFNPAPVTCGPLEPCVSESKQGEFFLGIGNGETGVCVARITAMDTLTVEDMGIAYLFAASPDLLNELEAAVEELEFAHNALLGNYPIRCSQIAWKITKMRACIAMAKGKGE